MVRNSSQAGQAGASTVREIPVRKSSGANYSDARGSSAIWEQLAWRSFFIAACVAVGYHFHPFNLSRLWAGAAGLTFGLLVFLVEMRLKRTSLRRLIGASVGTILGILAAYLMTLVLAHTSMPEAERSFIGMAVLLVMTYIGMIVGADKGDMLNLQAFGGVFGNDRTQPRMLKVVDTSVIIDGRIADICESHFVDGTLLVPAFVLRELQMVADSADPLKRQRGRRGLEVIQRIQKMPHVDVEVVDEDFPQIPEVDLKLIELAKRHDCKIVTNDFNLNKVAGVHGIEILNVNQLANALKPVVLPGEAMRVFILREGKEYNQGVAYLDDGTMVVVDGARKMINKTVDINVTSVHQTTAGKMIFGRYDDRVDRGDQSRLAANGTEGVRPEPITRSAETLERAPRPISPEPRVE
ncbi:MAG TPA: PIN domain-containing protein [Candidatus Acidoferrales bacterium]|nr:PIN domain-containing protein [Candidatus Acidoferrales bacterium]